MAQTAMTQLQQQIEAVRREAFAAGYRAAMQAIREIAAQPAPGAEAASAPTPRARRTRRRRASTRPAAERIAPAAKATTARRPRRVARPRGRAAGRRLQRGSNARMIEEILQSMAPRAVRPAEIRTALQRDKGVSMAFTSIRHALGQLEARQAAEQVGNSRTWRHRGGGAG
jgi:hypothetical protein